MEKLKIFVCENFYLEYQSVLLSENYDDVELIVYPSLCDQKSRKAEAKAVFIRNSDEYSSIICSRHCDALRLIRDDSTMRAIKSNYCFSHLNCDEFLDYLTSQGSYVISTGWLRTWKTHIESMGFDRETARRFFKETSNQLVFLDSFHEEQDRSALEELSAYLEIPRLIVSVELEGLRLLLKSMVFEWRLNSQKEKDRLSISELSNQCAEYAAVFDMLGRVSVYASRREVIGQIKELFLIIFGARQFDFWSKPSSSLPRELKPFWKSKENYLLLIEDNRFLVKVTWNNEFYGIIDVSGFMFPQYIERYLNLALEVSRIGGLVLHNNIQYEKMLASEEELKYLSYHDSMTGLFNRTYVNQVLMNTVEDPSTLVYIFDIDRLKFVNDRYGHAAGDQLIKAFARILKKCFREEDIVARMGGDEFVAILYHADDPEMIKGRLQSMIEQYNDHCEETYLSVSVSIGYAQSSERVSTIEEMMSRADSAMYAEKRKKLRIDAE